MGVGWVLQLTCQTVQEVVPAGGGGAAFFAGVVRLEQDLGNALRIAAAADTGGDGCDLGFIDPVVLARLADAALGMIVLCMALNTLVVQQIGIPNHIVSVIGKLNHGDVMTAPGPVTGPLQRNHNLPVAQGLVHLRPAEDGL